MITATGYSLFPICRGEHNPECHYRPALVRIGETRKHTRYFPESIGLFNRACTPIIAFDDQHRSAQHRFPPTGDYPVPGMEKHHYSGSNEPQQQRH